MQNLEKVTRFEVIEHTSTSVGRAYVKYGVSVSLDIQDDGRTLKVFISDSEIATSGEVRERISSLAFPPASTDDCGVCTRYADGTVLVRSECPEHGIDDVSP